MYAPGHRVQVVDRVIRRKCYQVVVRVVLSDGVSRSCCAAAATVVQSELRRSITVSALVARATGSNCQNPKSTCRCSEEVVFDRRRKAKSMMVGRRGRLIEGYRFSIRRSAGLVRLQKRSMDTGQQETARTALGHCTTEANPHAAAGHAPPAQW